MAFSTFALVVSTFALIRNGTNLTIMELNVFGCVSFDGFLAIAVIFRSFGQLHRESSNLVTYLKTKFLFENNYVVAFGTKSTKRFLLSLTPLKIKFGQVNFIEQMTPIVVLQYVQLANLLLCT